MVFAVETEDVLQAWALPIENNIGVGGFDLAPAANPLTLSRGVAHGSVVVVRGERGRRSRRRSLAS